MLRSRENGRLVGKAICRCTSLILGDAAPKHIYVESIQPTILAILDSEAQQGWFLAEPSHWIADTCTRVVGINSVEKCPRLSLAVVKELRWRTCHMPPLAPEVAIMGADSQRLDIAEIDDVMCSQLLQEIQPIKPWESMQSMVDFIRASPCCKSGCACHLPKAMKASFRKEMHQWLHDARGGKISTLGNQAILASRDAISTMHIDIDIDRLLNHWLEYREVQISLTIGCMWPVWQFPRFVDKSLNNWLLVGEELKRLHAKSSRNLIMEVSKEVRRLCHNIGKELDLLADAEDAGQSQALCGCDSP